MRLCSDFFQPLLLLFSLAGAQPTWEHHKRTDVSSYQNSVPLKNSAGDATLPPPTTTIKYITLGRGTQNYTCASASATPAAIGANATLYDISRLLLLPAPWGLKAVLDSPRIAVNIPTSLVPSQVLAKAIGHHYFNGGGQPTFDLGAKGKLVAKKLSNIPAPADASKGPVQNPSQDYGAVDWLKLGDAGGSVGLSEVYRVECAGGKAPPTCQQAGPLFQEYACLYWFYG